MADANIRAVITAKDEASAALKNFGNNANSVGDKIASVAKVAGVALLAASAAAVAFGVSSIKAYSESENELTQLNTVLKSTNQVAGVTAQSAIDLSKALQKTTKFSDEQVLSAENLLLTFTAIGKDIFPQATKTVLNMATALGEDTKSASIQLGKALQDPILGITALRRVGVNFSDAQKEVVKNLVETGRKAEAQKLILKELETEFGGSAEAAGGTFAGSLAKLKNSFNDIQETIGLTIVKALTPFLQKVAEFVTKVDWDAVIRKSAEAIKNLITTMVNLKDNIVNVYQSIISYISPGFERFIFIVKELFNWLSNMLGPSFNALGETIRDRVMPPLMSLWNAIEPGFTMALKIIAEVVGVVLVAAMWLFVNVLNVTASVLGFVIRVISTAIGWFGNYGATVINIFAGIPNFISTVFKDLGAIILAPFKWAFDQIKSGINDVKNAFNKVKSDIANAPSNVTSGIGSLFKKLNPFAEGTNFAPGGMALVGERGPEIINLPRGSQVIPNNKIGSSGSSINVTFNGVFTGSQMEFRQLAVKLSNALDDAKGMGTI